MNRLQVILMVTVAAGLLAATAGAAPDGLPTVRPPDEPPPTKGIPAGPDDPHKVIQRRIIELLNERRQELADQRAERSDQPPKEVDLDVMMKVLSDTRRPTQADWAGRLRETADFQHLTLEQQNTAVPELLCLLKNTTALPCDSAPAEGGGVEMRHRANAALARMASVSFGRMPAAGADPEAHKAAADLVERWAAWWNEVKDLAQAGRDAAASAARCRLIAGTDWQTARDNLLFIRETGDWMAFGHLTAFMGQASVESREDFDDVVQTFATLCRRHAGGRQGVPLEARQVLLDFLRRSNTAEVATKTRWLIIAGQAMNNLTGVQMEFEAVPVEGDEERRVSLLTQQCLDAWQEVLDKEKARAAADDDGDRAPDPVAGGDSGPGDRRQ